MQEKDWLLLAEACWQLEKRLKTEKKKDVEAEKTLQEYRQLLKDNGLEILDLTGQSFVDGLPAIVLKNRAKDPDKTTWIVAETIKPALMKNRALLEPGEVILSDEKTLAEEKNIRKVEEKPTPVVNAKPERPEETQPAPAKKKKRRVYPVRFWFLLILAVLLQLALLLGLLWFLVLGPRQVEQEEQNAVQQTTQEQTPAAKEQENTSSQNASDQETAGTEEKEQETSGSQDETAAEESTVDPEETGWISYTVQDGDSLWLICEKHGLDFDTLSETIIEENGLDTPDHLEVGQIILIPASSN